MTMPTVVTVGSNLTAVYGSGVKRLMGEFLKTRGKGNPFNRESSRFFTKAGAPVTNTAADSPGKDHCWIIDITSSDLYYIHTWVDSTHFVVVKIEDTAML